MFSILVLVYSFAFCLGTRPHMLQLRAEGVVAVSGGYGRFEGMIRVRANRDMESRWRTELMML